MQKSDSNQKAKATHRTVKSSTTLNRKYVKRPSRSDDITVSVKRSAKIRRFDENNAVAISQAASEQPEMVASAEQHPIQISVNKKMRSRAAAEVMEQPAKPTAKELKEQAIQKALAAASTVDSKTERAKTKKTRAKRANSVHFGFGRIMLALSCTAAAVFAIVYFVNLNMPDISLRVAAMQTGIEASYPSYVPRDFNLTDITSEDGKITLNFKNSSTGDAFSLVEERSSWDSNALLTNYVKDAYGENYTVVREQGLTIYSDNSNATWVNGGIVYKLKIVSGSLTKKQIRSIAVSL